MFCMECGTQLPDGAKFCMNCGTRLGQVGTPAPAVPTSPSVQPEKPKAPAVKKTMNCSMRNQWMVYVKSIGLFFTADQQSISFLPEGEKRVKKAVRKSTKLIEIHGLGYHGGYVYFWAYYEDENPYRLMRLDPITLEKTIVRAYHNEVSIGGDQLAPLYGDNYYTLHHHYRDGEEVCDLVKISVIDGEITRRPSVDLNAKKMPQSWLQPNGYFYPDEETGKIPETYNAQMNVFRAHNGYGYLSLSGGSPCTLRFPLDDPDQYEYMELDVCTAYDQGVLFQDGNILYSGQVGLRETCFWISDVSGGPVRSKKLLDLKAQRGLNEHGMNCWWQQGRRIYMEEFLYDIDQKKFIRMPADFSYFSAADFIADDKGGCYVICGRSLYYFPKDWDKNRQELESYLVADL